ncbi:hypothetical protein EVAR_44436_1 [Eumeta japonica]|uniref:Peptidase A2 domain-containing protein n=1 Tax=Eumeta variegata TaxID=151549 RepID=A0A4C1WJN5_EUMVA|nr:hypothetical protein EVAR_44436_1 [Eumeta japonica]
MEENSRKYFTRQRAHAASACPVPQPDICRVDGCCETHHRLLHNQQPPVRENDAPTANNPTVINSARPTTPKAYLKIIPVCLSGPKTSVDTYTLLDEGSTITMIDAAVGKAVEAVGLRELFEIQGVAGMMTDASRARKVTLGVRGRYYYSFRFSTCRQIIA